MNQFYNKHYIRVDENNRIMKGFSDAFEPSLKTDICINEEGGRHFELLGIVNPPLVDMKGCHLYKYIDGSITETTQKDKTDEVSSLPRTETQEEKQAKYNINLDYRLSKLELGV
ncbi:MAG: hypothetical protein ACERKN_01425 [Velocimicrobium sp.]